MDGGALRFSSHSRISESEDRLDECIGDDASIQDYSRRRERFPVSLESGFQSVAFRCFADVDQTARAIHREDH
jgi:hypothetical protein